MFWRRSKKQTTKKTTRRRSRLRPETVMLIRQIIIGLLLFGLVALIGFGVWHGTRVEALTIRTVTVSGGYTISYETVKQIAETKLEGSYLGFVPYRFAWWYPDEVITSAVSAIPRVKDPLVERVSGTEIAITIDEYIPEALWCAERDGDDCLFVDAVGYAFTTAPPLSGAALLRYRTLGREPEIGALLAPAEQLATIGAIASALDRDFSYPVAAIEFDTVGDVFYVLSGESEIKATARMTAAETLENLRLVLGAEEFTDLVPGEFSYIDLRFGSKVFVNDTPPYIAALASSTATSSVLDALVTDMVLATAPATTTASTTVSTPPVAIIPPSTDPETDEEMDEELLLATSSIATDANTAADDMAEVDE